MGVIKRNIPNFITCLNLLSGCIGIIFVFNNQPVTASYCMFAGAFFDFIDGLIARALKVTSPIGRDLDSLADVITFGLLPGVMTMNMFILTKPTNMILPFICLIMVVFSAIRLAVFNNDTEQSYSFKGLPTPANGIFWGCVNIVFCGSISSTVYIGNYFYARNFIASYFTLDNPSNLAGFMNKNPWLIIITVVLLSLLMVSRLPLISFKIHQFSFKNYLWHFILLILSLISAIIFGFASAPIILILYILISQIHFRTQKHEI